MKRLHDVQRRFFFMASLAYASLVLLGAAPASAQNYLFGVPKLKMLATIKTDGSTLIDYDIQFHNENNADPIDVVDIGVPHENYSIGEVKASLDGKELTDVRPSQFVPNGFEVHLDKPIRRGRDGTLRVQFVMPKMLYQDTTRDDYASFRITPTWFGDAYVLGNTNIEIFVRLPDGVQPDEVLHQGLPFTSKAKRGEETYVYWQFPTERLTKPHVVGLSFPKRGVENVIRQSAIDLLVEWFSHSEEARIIAGLVFAVLFGVFFFRFSGGTGVTVYVLVMAGAGALFVFHPGWHLALMPAPILLIGLNEWSLQRRKSHYMPPIAQTDGGGIKRGLTAPEAAVLLELPLSKVLSLIIFGLLKKGVARQVSADPLVVEINPEFTPPKEILKDADRDAFYRQAGMDKKIVIHAYEHAFLFLLQTNLNVPVKDVNFSLPMKCLVQATAAKLSGFDLAQTKEYYSSIVKRAAEQAAAIGDIPQRTATIDRNLEWILMDDYSPTVFDYGGGGYRPIWTRGGYIGPMTTPAGGGLGIPSGEPSVTPSFTDVAASFSGWAENTMGSLADSVSPDFLQTAKTTGGFLDLSSVDRVTGNILEAISDGSSGGGGGGGGCACAGCACACACAGGGR